MRTLVRLDPDGEFTKYSIMNTLPESLDSDVKERLAVRDAMEAAYWRAPCQCERSRATLETAEGNLARARAEDDWNVNYEANAYRDAEAAREAAAQDASVVASIGAYLALRLWPA